MRKQLIAFLTAFGITGIVALAMVVVGVNAAFNPNGVAVSNSPTQSAALNSSAASSTDPQQQIAQLQSLVKQYQQREQQYQTTLQNQNTQLSQATQQMQSVQQLLAYLQSRGIIRIDSQGQITVYGGRGGDGN